jgi:hypothetical protein
MQVCTFGGVYGDSDTIPMRPVAAWPIAAAMPSEWGYDPKVNRTKVISSGWGGWIGWPRHERDPTESARSLYIQWQGTNMPKGPHVGALVGWEQNNPADTKIGFFARDYQFLQVLMAAAVRGMTHHQHNSSLDMVAHA